jgi:hypothetical protein
MIKKIIYLIVLCIIQFEIYSQSLISYYGENGVGLKDSLGKIIVEANFEKINYSFSDGFYRAESKGKIGVIDSFGNIIIKPTYDEIGKFSEGLFNIRLNRKWGYLNLKGKIIIPLKYIGANPFKDGVAIVSQKKDDQLIYTGAINKEGKIVIPFIYDNVSYFSEDLAIVCSDDEDRFKKCGCVNRKGQIVIPLKYSELGNFLDGYAIATNMYGMKGVIDKHDKIIVPFKYNYIHDFQDGMAQVAIYPPLSFNKNGFVDYSGREIELIYSDAENFSEGFAAVKYGNYWGYINKEGKQITEFKYLNKPQAFKNGRGKAFLVNKWIFINPDGSESEN